MVRNQSRNQTLGRKSGLKSDVMSEIGNQPSLEIIAEIRKSCDFDSEISYAKTDRCGPLVSFLGASEGAGISYIPSSYLRSVVIYWLVGMLLLALLSSLLLSGISYGVIQVVPLRAYFFKLRSTLRRDSSMRSAD